jgi:histidinol-phosphate aminotransferase
LEPNEATLVILPTFFRFIESSLRMKGKIIKVSALAKDGFKFNEKLMKKVLILIKRFQPKIIWLCSPNNPTGETMTLEQIEIITKKSENLVAVDEAFQEFVDPENKKSAINLIKKHNNLLVLKTFSKSWRLSGIRFGFAIGSPKIIGILEKWRLPFTVSDISKQIVLNFIDRQDNIKPLITVIINNRRNLFNEIKKLKNFEIGADSKTNVFILRHKNKDIFKELLKHNILTADLRNLDGLKGKNFVRVTIKSKKENNILLKVLSIINL